MARPEHQDIFDNPSAILHLVYKFFCFRTDASDWCSSIVASGGEDAGLEGL